MNGRHLSKVVSRAPSSALRRLIVHSDDREFLARNVRELLLGYPLDLDAYFFAIRTGLCAHPQRTSRRQRGTGRDPVNLVNDVLIINPPANSANGFMSLELMLLYPFHG